MNAESNSAERKAWKCENCNHVNSLAAEKCVVCGKGKGEVQKRTTPSERWRCAECSHLNYAYADHCTICGLARDKSKSSSYTHQDVNTYNRMKNEELAKKVKVIGYLLLFIFFVGLIMIGYGVFTGESLGGEIRIKF